MFGIEKDFQNLMEQVYGPLKRNKMTDMTERAQKVREEARQALYRTPMTEECEVPIMVATLREVINQLQQSPGVIMCADVLELCEELEKL